MCVYTHSYIMYFHSQNLHLKPSSALRDSLVGKQSWPLPGPRDSKLDTVSGEASPLLPEPHIARGWT